MAATDRYVPGAPTQNPSKSKKKKGKSGTATPNDTTSSVNIPDPKSAALVEKAPETEDLQSGAVTSELIVGTPIEDVKLSPIVDLISKRLKAVNKKIKRINTYSSIDPLNLDEDQKSMLKNLPTLEAVQKELVEVKKAVESHEAELGGLLAAEKSRVVKAQDNLVSAAVTSSQTSNKKRASDVFTLLRLSNYLSQGDPAATSLNLKEQEVNAVNSAARTLLGSHIENQKAVIEVLFKEQGQYEGVALSRIVEITEAFLKATQSGQPNGNHVIPGTATPHDAPRPITSSFSFMQADELEAAGDEPESREPESELATDGSPADPEPIDDAPAPNQDNINWADDEGGLPSLSGLQEKFGASGSVTPGTGASTPPLNDTEEPAPNQNQEEGFVTPARGRGRGGGGRGHRGRGHRRGSFRGREGGERGSHRGRYDGGERGSYRGREGGERQSRGRGGGERGSRGRGEGRGRGGPPPPPTA